MKFIKFKRIFSNSRLCHIRLKSIFVVFYLKKKQRFKKIKHKFLVLPFHPTIHRETSCLNILEGGILKCDKIQRISKREA